MTYSIKRLRTDGDCCLIDLDSVESLDVFLGEVKKATRLWIDDLQVFATSQTTPSYDDHFGLKCNFGDRFLSTEYVTFYGTELTALTSVVERVLCLPDSRQDRNVELMGRTGGEPYEDLILTPEQLRRILSVRASHSSSFRCFTLTPEQSVELAAVTNLDNISFCPIRDEGLALVDWLEHHNGTRTLGTFNCQYYNAWENVLNFVVRSTFPVFNHLVFDQFHGPNSEPHRYDSLVRANVNSIVLIVNPYGLVDDEGGLLLNALRDGSLRSSKLELDFNEIPSEVVVLDIFKFGVQNLLNAMSSTECRLKELLFKVEQDALPNSGRFFEETIIGMLQENKSLETLCFDSTLEPLEFPAMGILNAAVGHPRLRNLVFIPPADVDPPGLDHSDPFQLWLRTNLSHSVRFDDWGRTYTEYDTEKWQDFIFFSRFGLLQQVDEERIRSHLLVAAIANHRSPQRIHFLLSGNLDMFAK